MKIPFHITGCREHWGCHPDCPVLSLARRFEEQEVQIANLERELQKKSRKKTDNG